MTTEPIGPATGFAADFPATEDAWRTSAEAALKGRPLASVTSHRTIDGVGYSSISPRVTPRVIAGRPAGARWTAMTRIDVADPEAANVQALEDLNNGASGLSLFFAGAGERAGLSADTLERAEAALDGVLLDLAPVHLDWAPETQVPTAALFAALVERRGLDPKTVAILFGLDAARDLARTGRSALAPAELGRTIAGALKELVARGFTAPALLMDQRIAHDAGATEAQELAGALAGAVDHIRLLTDNGLDAETVADHMGFAFASDSEQFPTIAKFRAARLLWAAVRRELGLGDKPVYIHAQTSRRMMTRKDPQTNMIRTTIAAFSAGVGGVDSLTVLPYTLALGGADADARRLARNAQSIVLEESNAYRVADPAAGAGVIENLTDALAAKAWELFREIEREGGLIASLTAGALQGRIAEARAERAKGVAKRKIAIVGVSEFPKAGEATATMPSPDIVAPAKRSRDLTAESFPALVQAFASGAALADAEPANDAAAVTAEPLTLARLAEPFETLREANEAAAPTAFIALLGPIARHAARAGFVRNLLAAGGVDAVDGPLDGSAEETRAAFAASGAKLAIVCGADADYAAGAEALVAALSEGGATVWLAGRPADTRAALEAAGVTRFVAAGDDALDTLAAATTIGGSK